MPFKFNIFNKKVLAKESAVGEIEAVLASDPKGKVSGQNLTLGSLGLPRYDYELPAPASGSVLYYVSNYVGGSASVRLPRRSVVKDGDQITMLSINAVGVGIMINAQLPASMSPSDNYFGTIYTFTKPSVQVSFVYNYGSWRLQNVDSHGHTGSEFVIGDLLGGGGAPSGPNSAGAPGQIGRDNQYLYVCTNVNEWKRIPFESFTS